MKGISFITDLLFVSRFAQPAAQRTITVRVLDGETKKPIRDAMVVSARTRRGKVQCRCSSRMAIDTVKQFLSNIRLMKQARWQFREAGQFSIPAYSDLV